MPAIFSPIDDEDELATMLYGVIGNLRKGQQSIRFDIRTRAGVAGRFIPLAPNVWIEGNYESNDSVMNIIPYVPYPEKWKKRVTIKKASEVIQYD